MLNHTQRPVIRKSRGLTLIEVLISALVLSIAIVGVSQLNIAAITFAGKARSVAAATQRAQREIEYVTTIPFADLRSTDINSHYPSNRYSGVAITDITTDTGAGKQITFSVSDLPSGVATITIAPYKTNYAHLLQASVNIGQQRQGDSLKSLAILNTLLADKSPALSDTAKIKVTPANVSLLTGDTQQFTAVVKGVSYPTITWKSERVLPDGTKTLVSAISSNGLFTAPSIDGAYHVTATTVVDGETLSATAVVTISSFPHIEILNSTNAAGEIDCWKNGSVTISTQLFDVAMGDGETLTFQILSSTGGISPKFSTSTISGRTTLVLTPQTRLNDVKFTPQNGRVGTATIVIFGKDLSGDPVTTGPLTVRVG